MSRVIKDRAAHNERSRRYYHEVTKLKDPGYVARKTKEYRQRYPERRLLSSARQRARLKRLDFNIDVSDIIIPEICPYLGINLVHNDAANLAASCSLDRIDSSKGYVKGNVQVISYKANAMKNNATEEELVRFAKAVLASVRWDSDEECH